MQPLLAFAKKMPKISCTTKLAEKSDTQSAITYSKLTIETIEQGVKYVQS